MSLTGAIARLLVHAKAISGIKDAPANPPDGVGPFPFAVAYPAKGAWGRLTDTKKGLHTIFVEFHFDRSFLPAAVAQATPVVESYPNLILNDPRLGGAVDTIQMDKENPVTYEFGRLEWAGVQTIGVRFAITVKIQGPFT